MNVLEALRRNPDQAVEIQDSLQAKKFLCELGMAGAFTDARIYSATSTVQIASHDGLKNHLVLALLFSGFLDPKDNGHMVFCVPRSGFEPGLVAAELEKSAAAEHRQLGTNVIICNQPRAGTS